jgi:AcrR family transcriptional regulator
MKIASRTRRYRQTVRAESAAATGRRVIDAFLKQLNENWYDEITLDRVAEDAGVTVQTVVRRFGGKAGLLAESIQAMKYRAKQRRATPPGDLDRLVRNLTVDYEASGDTMIRLLALEERHPLLHEHLKLARGWHRNWVLGVFAQHLNKLGAKQRQSALDALVIATDVYTWKLLRRDMGRSVAVTAATMKSMIHSTIDAYSEVKDSH